MRTFPNRILPALAVFTLFSVASGCSREPEGPAPAAAPSLPPSPASTQAAAPTSQASAAKAEAPAAPTGTAAAAAAPAAGQKLNVLMISVDSMRSDMPWLGYSRAIAPVMTELAKKSVSYSRFYAISSYTSMSLGGFLAGRYPSEVDRSGYFFGNYPESVVMFPELLQQAGVRTISAHAHFYFDVKAGFRQGFDDYKIVPGLSADNTTDKNITSPQHLALAKEQLSDKAVGAGQFFAWYHFLDPHDLYMQHEGIKGWGKKARDLYDGEIEFVDKHIGELLEWVNQQEWGKRTAIVITSDHGEAFGEHKQYRHGFEIWENLVHVPLIIHAPGITPRQIDVPRSAIDLAPTIMELVGVPRPEWFQGTSLVSELYGGEAKPRDVIVDLPRTSDNDRRRALIRGDYKITAYGDDFGYELYDIKNDPGETKDIKNKNREVFEEMKEAYKAKSATIKDVCPKMTEKLKGKSKGRKC
ncbi:MAG: sulfatase [Polyangiaceae bacterium]|nr:sulfatase [Polyangiaceae bacterium]